MKEFLLNRLGFNQTNIDLINSLDGKFWSNIEKGIVILNPELFEVFCKSNKLNVNSMVKAVLIDDVFVISEDAIKHYDMTRFTYKSIFKV